MPITPPWATGRHITAFEIISYSTDTAGTLSAAVTQTLYGHLKDVGFEIQKTSENISPMDSQDENPVVYEKSTKLTIREHEKRSGTNKLAAIGFSVGDYAKATWVRGGQTFTFWGLIESYNMDAQKPNIDGTLVIRQADIRTAIAGDLTNPAYG